MRSIKLCLLVFLTSYLLEPSIATGQFCEPTPSKPITEECEDKIQSDYKDKIIDWNLETSFGNRKNIYNGQKYVEMDIHRALYMKITGDLTDAADIQILEDKCKLYFKKVGTAGNKLEIVNAKTMKIRLVKNTEVVLAVFDPDCRMALKKINEAVIFQVFSSHMDAEKVLENVGGTETFIYERKMGTIEGNVNLPNLGVNILFPFPNELKSDKPGVKCNTKCKFGRIFEFPLKHGTEFANKFKLTGTCEWMTIRLLEETEESKQNRINEEDDSKAKGQKQDALAEISLRHGFAKLPLELNVVPMDFHKPEYPGDGSGHAYEVTVAYYVTDVMDGTVSKGESHIVIANSHGRAIRSFSMLPHEKKVTFAFSHNDCLHNAIGSPERVSSTDSSKKELYDFEFGPKMNLGAIIVNNGIDHEPVYYADETSSDNDLATNPDYYDIKPSDYIVEGLSIKSAPTNWEAGVIDIPPLPEKIWSNVTDKPLDPLVPTTVSKETQDQIDYHNKRKDEMLKRIAELKSGKWYFTWAIPAGFGCGSFGTFLICNIILFVFKRTVLTFWYKAMYKRYGSDTTMGAGTTMGKTMGGETIGGGTTMGGTTAGGTTAGGETSGTTAA